MLEYGITTLQSQPSLFKQMTLSKIVDKRKHQEIGYFISSKYAALVEELVQKIQEMEQREKLQRINRHTDRDFLEAGIDDGLA